jgi:hypothetical protein
MLPDKPTPGIPIQVFENRNARAYNSITFILENYLSTIHDKLPGNIEKIVRI